MANTHLIISNSIELLRIAVNDIICIKADGNYSDIHLPGNKIEKVTLQLGQVEDKITEQLPDFKHFFARLGKGIIINMNYIYKINLTSKKIILADSNYNKYEDRVNREILKSLKEKIEQKQKKE